ncbi:MAG: PAS domain-containing protein [candidate division Zixibacteria bacterium]|nr:PAS domain-containing protein [candidate division Zixibacteria bacterium]MBU1470879.1 PAS domain-containing protein [candidate division Zixibacteria bacterium]MBU2624257.1 PAS domain-containing protein [candidate division Zixibacteria bacterium]
MPATEKKAGNSRQKKKSVSTKKRSNDLTMKKLAKKSKSSGREAAKISEVPKKRETQPARRSGAAFPVVGIGASAGGLEAFETFFRAVPDEPGIAFVLVAHLDPSHVSLLPELLQKQTKMKVEQVSDRTVVKPNRVYVIPPNRNLGILRGVLHLLEMTEPRGVNLPIDSFFRSLAQDQGSDSVGIILSGTGTDGTLGLKAIKDETGMTMVQSEESAKYDGMPRSAISAGVADYILSPEKMPSSLLEYVQHESDISVPDTITEMTKSPEALQKICIILRARTGHDFSLYKANTTRRRIERRMNLHQIGKVADYVRFLQESDREAWSLFKELLVGVTSFFRDPQAFEVLANTVLPSIFSDKPDDYTARVWVPGCSSGEEAYSVGILFHEHIQKTDAHPNVQIFSTDLDEDAIDRARQGVYPESISADIDPERLRRHFTKDDDGRYRIKKAIREMLVFATQDVIKDPPFTKVDLLCCRNLLIYLGPELQRKLLPIFHYSLKSNGYLFLGTSETTGQATDLFAPLDKKWKIYRRKTTTITGQAARELRLITPSINPADSVGSASIRQAEELSSLQLAETILRQSDTLPCAIVDNALDVVYFHGRTGRYLEPAEGKACLNIVEMARQGLKAKLNEAIGQVTQHRRQVECRGVRVQSDGKLLSVDLTVKPLIEDGQLPGLMMITFNEISAPKTVTLKTRHGTAKVKRISAEELEQELLHTKESLQTTIEELQTSNEELRSTNEELQSTNEELQSTNEELETSKEELQSLNEESVTVNAELQGRIEELSKAHDDIKNLLDCTGTATLFLDVETCIRRFTPKMTGIFPLAGSDIGRPIRDLSSNLVKLELDSVTTHVLKDLNSIEREVSSSDGRTYSMRVQPYRTATNVIDGVVITFDNITNLKHTEKELQTRQRMLNTAAKASRTGFWEWDIANDSMLWTDGMFDIFGVDKATFQPTLERQIEFVHPDDSEIMSKEAIEEYKKQSNYELTHRIIERDAGETKYIRVWGEVSFDATGEAISMVGTVQDITQTKTLELQLREVQARWTTLTEFSTDHLLFLDVRGLIQFVNRPFLGLPRDRMEGYPLYDFIPSRHKSKVRKILSRVGETGESESYVFEFKVKNRQTRMFEGRIGPVVADGAIIGLTISVTDIADSERSEMS